MRLLHKIIRKIWGYLLIPVAHGKRFLEGLQKEDHYLKRHVKGASDHSSVIQKLLQDNRPFLNIKPEYLAQDRSSATTQEAEKTLKRNTSLFGDFGILFPDPKTWHRDPLHFFDWNPNTYFRNVIIPHGKADIKIPWELSRFLFLTCLGQAHILTKQPVYTRHFETLISEWIRHNPPEFGVNWACTMDVAIRSCNWIFGFCCFSEKKLFTPEFLLTFHHSLHRHGVHIRNNLEWSKTLTSNHYLSNIVGLLYLGVLFPVFKEADEWRTFAIQEIIHEMEKQVYEDGTDFEASTCYHRLVLELFFFSAFVVLKMDSEWENEKPRVLCEKYFGIAFTQKLRRMFEAVLHLLKPNGRMPQIGDNDSGRLHVLNPRQILDMRYLLTLGALFFEELRFKVNEFGFCEEALWLFGKKGKGTWDSMPGISVSKIESHAFPDSGWYVSRSGNNYCLMSCGPNGQKGNGGHAHNDKLSFELHLGGEDVIVDPGTYVYTSNPESRNQFRSTRNHNTVMVDDEEQNRFVKESLFRMKKDTHPKVITWALGEEMDLLIAEHDGYMRLPSQVIHRREFRFFKRLGILEIKDSFNGSGNCRLEWNFILAPKLKSLPKLESDLLIFQLDNAHYSAGYLQIEPTRKWTAVKDVILPFQATLRFLP